MSRRWFLALPFVWYFASKFFKAEPIDLREIHVFLSNNNRVSGIRLVKVRMMELKPRQQFTIDRDYRTVYRAFGHPFVNSRGVVEIQAEVIPELNNDGRTQEPQPA